MSFFMYIILGAGIVAVLCTMAALIFFKLYCDARKKYLEEQSKNDRLENEISKLKELEKVKDEARKETEKKLDEVDACSGIDRFNAINGILSNN